MAPTFMDDFASNFVRHSMLCEDFNKRKPVGPSTGIALLFERRYDSVPAYACANDVLRTFLIENGYEYINHLGEVWFLYRGNWHNAKFEVENGFYRFWLLEYELN